MDEILSDITDDFVDTAGINPYIRKIIYRYNLLKNSIFCPFDPFIR